jgi:hypothetical protein
MSRRVMPSVLAVGSVFSFLLLISALYCRASEASTFATLFAGIIAADVVAWQGTLIKQQIAFSTYLDLDKEWNSAEMLAARQAVHAPSSEEWDHSRLEAILEFFEKLASMFRLSGEMRFVYESTLGWYASRYFLFAREHGQIEYLRNLWQDRLYEGLQDLYATYLTGEAGSNRQRQREWEQQILSTEETFWAQERKP